MAKTERDLAFLRDLDINENYTKRFTDVIDKHVDLKKAGNILYINAGTGDHCIAIRETVGDKPAMFATCENGELLNIARDKGAAMRAEIDFTEIEFEDDSFDAVIADASFTRPSAIADLLNHTVRHAKPGGQVAVVLPSAGSFGEVFSLVWEVLFNEDLGEHGAAAESLVSDIPTISRLQEMAAEAGLGEVKTELSKEELEYANGAEFVASPLVADFLMPVWLEMLDEDEKTRVTERLAKLIDEEDADLSFRFSVKVTLLTGTKS